MADEQNLIAAVGMDLDAWNQGMRQLMSDESKIEDTLSGVVDAANAAEAALNSIGGGDIQIGVDDSQLEQAKTEAEALDGMDASVQVTADDAELQAAKAAAETLDSEAVDVTITATDDELEAAKSLVDTIDAEAPAVTVTADDSDVQTAKSLVDEIDAEAPSVTVTADDSDVQTAKSLVDTIDAEAPSVTINADDTQVVEANSLLTDIRNMEAFNLVMNVTGTALDFIQNLQNIPGIDNIVELDNAMGHFEATTGDTGVHVRDLVDDLHGQGVIASITDIGAVAEKAHQLGINLRDVDDAALAAFNTAAVTGGNAADTLTQMNNLVESGLVENFQEASDLIVTGLQNGANRGGDFLTTLNQSSAMFASLGINGQQALGIINSGLDAGYTSAQAVADSVSQFSGRITAIDPTALNAAATALANGDANAADLVQALGPAGQALADLNLLPQTEAFLNGDLSGADYFDQVTSALDEVTDSATQAQDATALFGDEVRRTGSEAAASLTTEGGPTADELAGNAQAAADDIRNTIGGAISEIQQELGDLAAAFFSSDQLDIDGKLDAIKTAIHTFIDEINSGATFGEALEVSIGMPGLEDNINDLEGALGNFLLGFMSAIANVLSIIPGQEAAVAQIRSSVADMADDQLTFDIGVADDAQGVTDSVQRAIDRGVDSDTVAQSIQSAFDTALANGDVATAQAIASNIEASAQQTVTVSLDSGGAFADVQEIPSVTASLELDTSGMQAQIDTATSLIHSQIDSALQEGDIAGATALADSIGSSLTDEFQRYLDTNQFNLADLVAQGVGDTAMQQTAADAAAAYGYTPEAMANIQQDNADIISGMNDVNLAAATSATETTAATDETSAALTTAATDTSTFADQTTTSYNIAGDAVHGYADTVETEMTRVNTNIDTAIASAGELAAAFSGATGAADAAVGAAPPVAGHAAGTQPGHPATGIFTAGEDGTELLSTDTSLSILNNQTTESILSGLAALLSGGYGGMGGGSSVTINQSNTFNNNGGAASTASLDRASAAIRGY